MKTPDFYIIRFLWLLVGCVMAYHVVSNLWLILKAYLKHRTREPRQSEEDLQKR